MDNRVGSYFTYPLELVCMDFLTLEPAKGDGNVVVIMDHYTKYALNPHSTGLRFHYAHSDHGVSLNYSKLPQLRGPVVKFWYLHACNTLPLRFVYASVTILPCWLCCTIVTLFQGTSTIIPL